MEITQPFIADRPWYNLYNGYGNALNKDPEKSDYLDIPAGTIHEYPSACILVSPSNKEFIIRIFAHKSKYFNFPSTFKLQAQGSYSISNEDRDKYKNKTLAILYSKTPLPNEINGIIFAYCDDVLPRILLTALYKTANIMDQVFFGDGHDHVNGTARMSNKLVDQLPFQITLQKYCTQYEKNPLIFSASEIITPKATIRVLLFPPLCMSLIEMQIRKRLPDDPEIASIIGPKVEVFEKLCLDHARAIDAPRINIAPNDEPLYLTLA